MTIPFPLASLAISLAGPDRCERHCDTAGEPSSSVSFPTLGKHWLSRGSPRARFQANLWQANAYALFPSGGCRRPKSISNRLTPMSFSRWSSIADSARAAARRSLRLPKAPTPTRNILSTIHSASPNCDSTADVIAGFSIVVASVCDLLGRNRSCPMPWNDKVGGSRSGRCSH